MVLSPDERAPDWRDQAACRAANQEMVPDGGNESVKLAKKTCISCSVLVSCLYAAEAIAARHGSEYAQGIWGGLTRQERDTMVGLNRWPAPCTSCGLDCVPINLSITECSACKPSAMMRYADYREQILELVNQDCSYDEIATRLRLSRDKIARICSRWNAKAKKRSAMRRTGAPRKGVLPCGTEAAKYRHHRRERKTKNPADGFRACPLCRNVPWTNRKTPKK